MAVGDRSTALLQLVALMETNNPSPLDRLAQGVAAASGEDALSAEEVAQLIRVAYESDAETPFLKRLHRRLAHWDAVDPNDPWAGGTPANSRERRDHIYAALGVAPASELRAVLEQCTRFYPIEPLTQIGHAEFVQWWTPERKGTGFYGDRYLRHLEDTRHMPSPLVEEIDRETDRIVSLLADPRREQVLKIRGLVLGHVQSGKTTNYAGVMAKCADAGYRLIIVLTGMTNLLRDQTQRRLDMDLVGQEVVRSQGSDYIADPEWARNAVSYGSRPREILAADAVNFVRLTTASKGYKSLSAGISALEPQKVRPDLPLYHPENLAHADIRLAVIKKRSEELTNLTHDLETLPRQLLAEIPTVIVDDECDLASINTKKADAERTKINELLVGLLKLLPRAQYIGYTATPAASILVDLEDSDDIFPRSFLIALEPRPGYMGAASFHDLDWDLTSGEEKEPSNSNEARHARPIKTSRDSRKQPELEMALDLYVLTGAIKLYRESLCDGTRFRHHTMLVHESHKKPEHRALKKKLLKTWDRLSYRTPAAMSRLWAYLESDIRPTTEALGGVLPPDEEVLRLYVARALDKIGVDPVLVVNSDDDADTPDFYGAADTWKILCGGTKLSRGYTIEGLTITYFRRIGRAADTLMQMCRWFGYREGYEDLVRLFIGTEEPWTKTKKINLYRVFEALAQDDRRLRESLRAYDWRLGDPYPVTPAEILPEVFQAHADVRPTARNKMYRAAESGNWGGRLIQSTLLPNSDKPVDVGSRVYNVGTWLPNILNISRMEAGELEVVVSGASGGSQTRVAFPALLGAVAHEEMLDILGDFRWREGFDFSGQLNFLQGGVGDPEIDSWAVVFPQLRSKKERAAVADHQLSVIERATTETGRFGVFTDPGHVVAARTIARTEAASEKPFEVLSMSEDVDRLRVPRRGVVLLYLMLDATIEEDTRPLHAGFALMCPRNQLLKPGRVWVARRHDDGAALETGVSHGQ